LIARILTAFPQYLKLQKLESIFQSIHESNYQSKENVPNLLFMLLLLLLLMYLAKLKGLMFKTPLNLVANLRSYIIYALLFFPTDLISDRAHSNNFYFLFFPLLH